MHKEGLFFGKIRNINDNLRSKTWVNNNDSLVPHTMNILQKTLHSTSSSKNIKKINNEWLINPEKY